MSVYSSSGHRNCDACWKRRATREVIDKGNRFHICESCARELQATQEKRKRMITLNLPYNTEVRLMIQRDDETDDWIVTFTAEGLWTVSAIGDTLERALNSALESAKVKCGYNECFE